MNPDSDQFSSLDFSVRLQEEIKKFALIKEVPQNAELMHEGQFVNIIPIVLKGLVKVFTRHEDKELLLYYIKPGETCIISFNAALSNSASKAYAVSEEDSKILLIPTEKIFVWMKEFPELNSLFFQQYNNRYNELIEMVNKVLFEKMDKRLHEYLKTKSKISQKNILKISHQQIANDLGTAREVVTRVLKKLEHEKKVIQVKDGIKVLR
ncbi:Crp/Fnr family transcriptional regulator [Mariniphaga sp.]|uniref:Crp/Fnr family transcriptional regulator n=1 Tax=Mariniphaga sp. TaxID=1954475 RepID=UPI0035630DEB